MKAVTAVCEGQIRNLGAPCGRAIRVIGAAQDFKEPQHDAFIGDRIEIVQLGGDAHLRIGQIQIVRRGPENRLVIAPLSSLQKVVMLIVVAGAAICQRTNAKDPFLPERIIKHRASVIHQSGFHGLRPVQAVSRYHREPLSQLPGRLKSILKRSPEDLAHGS